MIALRGFSPACVRVKTRVLIYRDHNQMRHLMADIDPDEIAELDLKEDERKTSIFLVLKKNREGEVNGLPLGGATNVPSSELVRHVPSVKIGEAIRNTDRKESSYDH